MTPPAGAQLRTAVWGTGNVGRAAIRAVDAHPGLELAGVVVANPEKAGRDAGELAGLGHPLGIVTTLDAGEVLSTSPAAVVYAASGDLRPDDAAADIGRALRAGAVVVTPSLYALYDRRSAPASLQAPLLAAAREGGSSLFVSGIDPGWANDALPVLLSGLAGTVEQVRCQEIFDYASYDQPSAVRDLVGMGQPMDETPPMVAPGVPTMVWGGQVRMMARALAAPLDDVVERVERRPLARTITTDTMGTFAAGTQGALRFEVQGIIGGEPRIVVEHVTRIHPACAPEWPAVPDGGEGAHRIIIEGRPRLVVTVTADDGDEGRAAGGNATAAARLVNAIPWLLAAPPGCYDALDVPLVPATDKLKTRSHLT